MSGRARQSWNPEGYARNARFVADLGTPLVDLLAPRPGERILDLGCGDGALSAKLVEAGAEVLGLDSSPEQVAGACKLGIDARVGDGQGLDFSAEFDAVFSNAALHWMLDPDRVIDGIWRALKPGGRFVGEMGGAGNVAKITALLTAELDRRGLDGIAASPWYFPSPEAYREKLEARGFKVESITLIPRPTRLPGELEGWLETFAEAFVSVLPPGERAGYVASVKAGLAPRLKDAEGHWWADYVRLRFAAVKPA